MGWVSLGGDHQRPRVVRPAVRVQPGRADMDRHLRAVRHRRRDGRHQLQPPANRGDQSVRCRDCDDRIAGGDPADGLPDARPAFRRRLGLRRRLRGGRRAVAFGLDSSGIRRLDESAGGRNDSLGAAKHRRLRGFPFRHVDRIGMEQRVWRGRQWGGFNQHRTFDECSHGHDERRYYQCVWGFHLRLQRRHRRAYRHRACLHDHGVSRGARCRDLRPGRAFRAHQRHGRVRHDQLYRRDAHVRLGLRRPRRGAHEQPHPNADKHILLHAAAGHHKHMVACRVAMDGIMGAHRDRRHSAAARHGAFDAHSRVP